MDQRLSQSLQQERKANEIRHRSLHLQIMLARFWLPATIVGVVLVHQLSVVPLGGESWQFWSVLLFYSILGPAATFATLNWIGSEVKKREEAQVEFQLLYLELQKSHALLGKIQQVTEQFASAPDLETALSAASDGITKVTGAQGAAIFLATSSVSITQSYNLEEGLAIDASARDHSLRNGLEPSAQVFYKDKDYWVLTAALGDLGHLDGSVHAYYDALPSSDQRESFSILVAEFSAAAEAVRGRTRDLLTLVEVDRSIRAEGNLQRLLETLLTQMMMRTEAGVGGVYLLDEENVLRLQVCQGVVPSAMNRPIRVGQGFIGEVASLAVPRIASQLEPSERVGLILRNAASAVALPLVTEQELLGVLVLAHFDPLHFEVKALPFLNLVAGQVSLAVRNARAYLQSEELAIAEERARIAREIHDGVAQTLAFSALKLDLVSRLLDKDNGKAQTELQLTKDTLRETIKEVRRSIFALRPIDLERHGFIETIRQYCKDYGEQNDIQVDLCIETIAELSAKNEAVLFRIFQEAMHNVAKHAGATDVAVDVGMTSENQAYIRVHDNGLGFDIEKISDRVTSAGGLGLKQMKERVESREGKFSITSIPEQGTQVYASVPT